MARARGGPDYRGAMSEAPIVFVVDDDVSVREALQLLVESAGWRAETFGSGRAFLSRQRAPEPSCLLLDVVLPDLNGCELQTLLADRVEMPILFISGHGDVPTTVRAMKAGAAEFFTKPLADDLLLSAIQNAMQRSRATLRDAAERRAFQNDYASLSRRERQVMDLIVSGRCRLNKDVGAALGISETTVKVHRGNMMRKMKAQSLAELVRMASARFPPLR